MKIQAIVTIPYFDGNKEDLPQEITLQSLKANDIDWVRHNHPIDMEQKDFDKTVETLDKDTTHVLILANGCSISEGYREIITPYIKNEKAVYLPLAAYIPKGEFKIYLNTVLWNPYFAQEAMGEMTVKSGLQQLNTTLYGALIPVEVLKETSFKEEILYYYQFEFLNNLLNQGIEVLGVSKDLVTVTKDMEFSHIDNNEKVKYFEKAREVYSKAQTSKAIQESKK